MKKTSDPIERQDAINAITEMGFQKTSTVKAILCRLETLPSAQPEIIRCKECKHNANPPEAGNADCDLFYGMTEQYGFCHRAERRTDG